MGCHPRAVRHCRSQRQYIKLSQELGFCFGPSRVIAMARILATLAVLFAIGFAQEGARCKWYDGK